MRMARDQTGTHGICHSNRNNRYSACDALGSKCSRGAIGNDYVNVAIKQFTRERGESGLVSIRDALLKQNICTVGIPKLSEPLTQCVRDTCLDKGAAINQQPDA